MKDATTNKIYHQLTRKEVLNLSSISLKIELDFLYDEACNIDYILSPISSDIIHRNISLIESILIHKEY